MKANPMSLTQKQRLSGWIFLAPATLLIVIMSFIPMIQAFLLSMQTGKGNQLSFAGLYNYGRLFKDAIFVKSLANIHLSDHSSPDHAPAGLAPGLHA